VLQLFCFEIKNTQPTHVWPAAGFELKVNTRAVTIRKAHKKLPDQVADITSFCKSGINSVMISSQAYMPYVVVINLMKKCTTDVLVDKIINKKMANFDETFSLVQRSFQNRGNDELQEISSKISLRCPLTRSPIVTPTRASTCNHFQCFELRNYLMMNERIPQWTCPICSKSALFKNLIIDSYMAKIISSLASNADDAIDEVVIQPDGTWITPPQKRKAEEMASGPSKKVFVEVLDLSDEDQPVIKKEKEQDEDQTFEEIVQEEKDEQKEQKEESQTQNGYNTIEESITYPNSCFICGIPDTKRCSRCKRISYCGRECQSQDWDRHKLECYPPVPPPTKVERQPSIGVNNSQPNSPKQNIGVRLGTSAINAIVLDD